MSQSTFEKSLKPRPRVEYVSEYGFRRLAHFVVLLLLPLKVAPTNLVIFHTVLGVVAGFFIAQNQLIWAAVLIQIKTVLDNADGQLARASGMVSEIGRYADTEGDFVVNLALFAGLGALTGQWFLATLSFVIFTLMLSLDFNWEYLYRLEREEYFRPAPDTSKENQKILGLLEQFYKTVFLPQDNLIRRFCEARFAALYAKNPNPTTQAKARLAYYEADSLLVLANLELSTQLLVLGLLLVVGLPHLFLWFVVACGVVCVLLQSRREARAIKVLQPKRQPRVADFG
ncbi:MAG: CDP-alcohol phosphatidyltransferase family protein [Deinococcales bacterium]